MIKLKSPKEIEKVRKASVMVAQALDLAATMMNPGITTAEIDRAVDSFIRSKGGRAAFKGYGDPKNPYPAATCISIDDEVVHGIPGKRSLENGMIVGVDIGVELDGYFGDSARTFAIGEVSDLKKRLMAATKDALELAIAVIKPNESRLSDIGHTVQTRVEREGFSVVRDLVGHGIGQKLHEEPQIPNFGTPGRGVVLKAGMTLAIEPMINAGTFAVKVLNDGWTVVTVDGKPSAHYEHTVVITETGVERLTVINAE